MYEPRKYTVGTVQTTDPYGKPTTYYTVFQDGREDMHASYRDTADEVIDLDLFPAYAWPGGYTIAYYPMNAHGDLTGEVICAECARAEYRKDPEQQHHAAIVEDSEHSTGLYCDGCNQPIIAAHCVDCSDDLKDVKEKGRLIFLDEAGEYFLCSHCLAQAVTRQRAHKTGKQQYRVTDEWYTGSFTAEGAH
jgi:hypothetical protein